LGYLNVFIFLVNNLNISILAQLFLFFHEFFGLESSTDPSELLSIHNYSRRDLGASTEEPLARPNPAGEGDPFGMEMLGPWMQSHPASMDYLYNSKEFNFRGSLGWYDYGARWYDPTIGRWNAACPVIFQQKIVGKWSMKHQGMMTVASDRTYDGMDPLADHPNQINMSPFGYAWNNPIYWTDPDGLCPTCPEDATYGSIHYWGGAEFTFDGENWSTTMDELVVAGYDMDNASFFMEGVVFYNDGGRGQETKQGYGEYVDAGPIITAAGATGANGKAHPLMRLGSIFSKFGNIITGWNVGHELSKKSGNNSMVDLSIKSGENKDPFNRKLPAYMQVSRETRRLAIDQYINSQEYRNRSGIIGVDTTLIFHNDTIVPTVDVRTESPRRDQINRRIKIINPKLKR